MKIVENLNSLVLPLKGIRLIEASAGTGKTYTLTTFYLRLLLGLGGETAFYRPLNVEEILVVTFTEAATDELRVRIRDNIYRLRLACMYGKSEDPMLLALLAQLDDYRLASLHLLAAERRMDEAAIFTIHGFCQRMLNYSTIESDLLFQQTILVDETLLCQQASADFWRRHFYPLPLEIARVVQQEWKSPEKLLEELMPYLHGDLPKICNPPELTESILERHTRIISDIDNIKRKWRAMASEIPEIINAHKLDRRIYNNKNLTVWLTKINHWAEKLTVDYQVPDELNRFKSEVLAERTSIGNPPNHTLFTSVQDFYKNKISLRDLVFVMALSEIRQTIKKEKQRRAELGFDDLLSRLDSALVSLNGETLAKSIRLRYPVAMIDEFQDTDPQQYRIFRRIYYGKQNCALLLIGDPKQAIYAFRGADIFTYMRARGEVDACYTINTNWRSAPGLINAINQLFQSLPVPFIFSEIPFLPVAPTKSNACLQLVIKGQPQSAMCVWLQSKSGVSVREYQDCMAQQCATTVFDWLHAAHKGEAWLEGRHGRQLLQASDIKILVRNRHEAALIRDALALRMIQTVYLSNMDSVFDTNEARELLWILQAVLTPEKDTLLRTALATNLLSFNAVDIDDLNNDEKRWEEMVEEFANYRLCWQNQGVLPMLYQMLMKYRIAENILVNHDKKHQLTNILHLGELLQETSTQLENEHTLVRWLALQIASPNPQAKNQQLRLESDHHLVQIITVYKSKGMEFPIVFLPFAANFRMQKQSLFHDRKTYLTCLDLLAGQESLRLAEEERLAEDLRLLYVAITRSIYHCSLGIASLYYSSYIKTGISNLHLSALGHLIQQGKYGDANYLADCLSKLTNRANGDISICKTKIMSVQPFMSMSLPSKTLSARRWPELPRDLWRVTSYSGLQYHSSSVVMKLQPRLDISSVEENEPQETLQLTPHTFPRGASSGTFLHNLFEVLNFKKSLSSVWLTEYLTQHGFSNLWLPVIINWIEKIITIPLDGGSLSLERLAPNSWLSELQFYLSIDALVQENDLDQLCKQYDPLSARCPPLDFLQIKGMLKGFIDLVFRWKGRYYLLDYKSNWLGKKSADYTLPAMEQAIIIYRYDLQYQLYTLALHRHLRHRLENYNYSSDFGGVYYLFIRGIDASHPGNGIFYCYPNSALIDRLDALFSGAIVT